MQEQHNTKFSTNKFNVMESNTTQQNIK